MRNFQSHVVLERPHQFIAEKFMNSEMHFFNHAVAMQTPYVRRPFQGDLTPKEKKSMRVATHEFNANKIPQNSKK